ncbi:MAG: 2Fe-2S iron-sulfur cluster-binding protein [Woeseiaceae bacterium]|nr:2Fe-2S iron-sulfur cluster-binding protein [Woeseiaceae bacterium]
MRQYHSLTIADIVEETADARRVRIDVPEDLRDTFSFQPGQHLPLAVTLDGEELRRTYSICSAPGEWPIELGIRVQPGGRFSAAALGGLRSGDKIRVMPPFGRFHADVDATATRHYVGFAAGSGITPILSMIRTVLRDEPGSRFTLFYGNRKQGTTMFVEELFSLKNQYPDRLQMQFIFSREEQEFPIAEGRLDGGKAKELIAHFCRNGLPDEIFLCGPDTMIDEVTSALTDSGVDATCIHSERFGAPRTVSRPDDKSAGEQQAEITVIMDGHRKSFSMSADDGNIVDAAASKGVELPYSCKGGVCATCRTHVRQGDVTMALNYGLEPWEVEAGFVLACQSTPKSDEVVLDYDKA